MRLRQSGGVGLRRGVLSLACITVGLTLVGIASSADAPAPSFAEPKTYATADGPGALAGGDLNADGKPDLVTANGKTISVLLNRGDGGFHARRDYRASGENLAIGDLNGDRKLDLAIVAAVFRNPRVSVLLNRGDGSLGAKRDYRTGRGPAAVAIGDLNGDRKLDLATTSIYDHTVSVLLNRGDGSFRVKRDYRVGQDAQTIAIADLNADRKLDLAIGRLDTVSVLLNRGASRFRAKRDYRTGPDPVAIAVGDLNGDRKPDLVTTSLRTGKTVSVLLNRGAGRFRAKRDYRTGGVNSVAIGDLNGDRKPDLVTGNGWGFVSVLLNRGNGSFQARLDYRAQAKLQLRSSGAEWVAIGELNGDGKVDLVTSNMDDDAVAVLINTPSLCVVQDVRRMTLPVATRMLARVNCQVGEVASDYSEAFKRGLVMRQKPAPGTVGPDGDNVDLVVSLGRKS